MPRSLTLTLTPKQAADAVTYTTLAARQLGISDRNVALVRVIKRSIDARRGRPKVNLTLEVYIDNEPHPAPLHFDYPSV
ncbi:MAG: FAD-binding protein, partial [Alistipes sp.]|nr:FAD-binding protein [Alistipes sp.]